MECGSSGDGVTGQYKPLMGVLGTELGPLEEQPVSALKRLRHLSSPAAIISCLSYFSIALTKPHDQDDL